MKINLNYKELMEIVYSVLSKDYKVVLFKKPDKNDINTMRVTLYSNEKRDKVLINFKNDHIDVISNHNDIIENLQKSYIDYISFKYLDIKKQKDELTKVATQIADKLRSTIINTIYNEGLHSVHEMLKTSSNFNLASALDYVRCGNHTTFIKMDNPLNNANRDIKIGDVYVANLNPVVDAEYGGIRSVVIIGYDKEKSNYLCVPCTTNPEGGYDIEFKTDKDLYAVTSKVKIISPIRLFKCRGHLEASKLKELKDQVQSSYAYFEEKETEEQFKSSISYKQSIENTKTLEQLALLYPIKKPSKEVIINIMKSYVPTLESFGMVINKRNGEIEYRCNADFKNNTIITLNPKIKGQYSKYSPTEYDFSLFHVKRKRYYDLHGNYDRNFTIFYQKYMMESNPYYFIHVIKYICNTENMLYRKKFITTDKQNEEYLKETSKHIQSHFKELGIDYNGDFKKIITEGANGFELSKLKLLSAENQIDENVFDESEDENE